MRATFLTVVGATGALLAPGVSLAQSMGYDPYYEYEPPMVVRQPEVHGAAFHVGGGVLNFLDEEARGRVGVGGSWDLRLTLGAREVAGVELAYRGSAQRIADFRDAFLVGNGAEVALRLNTTTGPRGLLVTPFALLGVGWTRYDVIRADRGPFMEDVDNVFTFPLGAGISVASDGLYIDARFTYRPTFDEALVRRDGDLSTWEVGAHIGAEF